MLPSVVAGLLVVVNNYPKIQQRQKAAADPSKEGSNRGMRHLSPFMRLRWVLDVRSRL
jgi:hypothetical protein